MPPTRRRFHTNSKKNKKLPETAYDFLSAGIEYEESGDRWRPGDKPKAGRFYQRAIEAYQMALRLNPQSFDSAYNKARLEYKYSQERELVSRGEVRGLLEMALQSHLYCLALDMLNEDALFNTAQVHSSLADAILNSKDSAPHRQEAIRHLTTACEMFNACLEKQQAIYASYSALPDASMDSEQATGGVSLGAGAVNEAVNEEESMEDAPEDDEDSQYAVIQEPVTPSTILDTTIELLSTMSNLLPLLTEDASQLHVVQSTAESLASTKLLPLSTTLPERALEISITAAVLRCAIAESHLRSGADQDPTHWEAAISYAFDPAVWAWQQSFDGLCAKSDAHAALASALLETPGSPASMAWKHYAFASQALGNAATLEPAKASVYLARGDTELIRSRIENPQKTEAVRGVLLKNAGVFYRGAMRLGSGDIKREAEVKEAALRAVGGDATGMELLKGREARDILEEAVEDDVFEEGVLGLLEG